MSQNQRTRAEIATAALAGLLADHTPHPELCREGETCAQATARSAVEHADALLAELQSEKNKPT